MTPRQEALAQVLDLIKTAREEATHDSRNASSDLGREHARGKAQALRDLNSAVLKLSREQP